MKSTQIYQQFKTSLSGRLSGRLSRRLPGRLSGQWIKAALVVSFSALAITACGRGSSSSAPGIVVNPDGSVVGGHCPVGQIYSPTSGCVSSTAYASARYNGSMSVVDQASFANMLRIQGYCDPYTLVNFGTASCSTYTSRAVLVLNVSASYAQGVLYAGASSIYNISGAMIPLTISGQLNPINNSTGFVVQSSTGLQLYIDSGTLGGNNIPAHITYQGGTIGNLTLSTY